MTSRIFTDFQILTLSHSFFAPNNVLMIADGSRSGRLKTKGLWPTDEQAAKQLWRS
jgi:hypothetical protein